MDFYYITIMRYDVTRDIEFNYIASSLKSTTYTYLPQSLVIVNFFYKTSCISIFFNILKCLKYLFSLNIRFPKNFNPPFISDLNYEKIPPAKQGGKTYFFS